MLSIGKKCFRMSKLRDLLALMIEPERERRSDSRRALNRHMPSVKIHDAFENRKPKTEPLIGSRGIRFEESVENPINDIGCHADAGISD